MGTPVLAPLVALSLHQIASENLILNMRECGQPGARFWEARFILFPTVCLALTKEGADTCLLCVHAAVLWLLNAMSLRPYIQDVILTLDSIFSF